MSRVIVSNGDDVAPSKPQTPPFGDAWRDMDRRAEDATRHEVYVAVRLALLRGAADQIGRRALLLAACGFERGLLVEVVVGNLLFPLLPAQGWHVGRVALGFSTLAPVRGPARPSCLVRKEEEPDARGTGGDRVTQNEIGVADCDVWERAHGHNRDRAAEGIRAEAGRHI
jgi:hypothetical protein